MGPRQMAEYMAWREQRSQELVGPYATKTAGAFVSTPQRRTSDGWLYGGRDAFCFFADNPVELAYLSPPGRLDQRTLLIAYQDCDVPKVHSIPGGPNLIVDFGGGREFAGAKDRMEQLVRLWQMWASGSEDPEVWRQVADVSGLPLYSRPVRIQSNPPRTALGAVLGLVTSIASIWSAATGSLQPGWPGGVVLVVALVILLLILGRFLPNIASGFALVTIAGSVVSSIVAFTQGYATTGLLWLAMVMGLLLVRLWLPRVASRSSRSTVL